MPLPSRYADRTLIAYAAHADDAIASWSRLRPSTLLREFARQLPRGAAVLDYGCGIGTDMAWLRRRGFAVEGIDGTAAFVREAQRRNPGCRVQQARFETVSLPTSVFDGIWCQAALIHVPPPLFRDQLAKLRRALKPGGLLAVTLAWGRTRAFTNDWIPGRYFAGYSKSEAARLFRGWRIKRLAVVNHDGRQGRWIHVLVSANPAGRDSV